MAAKVVFFSSGFVEASPEQRSYITLADKWPSSAAALWRPALKHLNVCGMLRMAAKVVFFSSGLGRPALKQCRFLRLRMAAKMVFFSSGFVEASPETVQVLRLRMAAKVVFFSSGFV